MGLFENERIFPTQGTLELMAAIFDTRDVYLMREEVIDLTSYRWYDVTEYEATNLEIMTHPSTSSDDAATEATEGGEVGRIKTTIPLRRFKSPLLMMLTLDYRHLAAANLLIGGNSIFRQWMEKSIKLRKYGFMFSFLAQLVYVSLQITYEMDRHWMTSIGGVSDRSQQGIRYCIDLTKSV